MYLSLYFSLLLFLLSIPPREVMGGGSIAHQCEKRSYLSEWLCSYIQKFITYLQLIPDSVISVAEKQAADSLFMRNKVKKPFEAKFCSAHISHTSVTTRRD